MEETAVHGGAIQHAKRAAIRVRKNSFTPELGGHLLESRRDFVERFVPANTAPN
jgi:hypothetical protein